MNISEIKVNEGRRTLASEGIKKLAESIASVGLLNPITVNEDNTLIAGYHRLEAAKQLGWTEISWGISFVIHLLFVLILSAVSMRFVENILWQIRIERRTGWIE